MFGKVDGMQIGGLNSDFAAAGLSREAQDTLRVLARLSLDRCVRGFSLPEVDPSSLAESLRSKAASFVTLRKSGELRGCMGNIIAQEPLYLSVIRNAQSSALRDPRFEAVRPEELSSIRIELSVLSPLQPLHCDTKAELLEWLRNTRPGVVLRVSGRSVTYLPQVWEMLPEPENFLRQLALKGGFDADAWRLSAAEIQVYTSQTIKEADPADGVRAD
jgi:AmmeMemoRadiSam system protein A